MIISAIERLKKSKTIKNEYSFDHKMVMVINIVGKDNFWALPKK